MASSTPLVVNRLPALVEYLGDRYPLFYDDLAEAGEICNDDRLILEGHRYLKHMDKRTLSFDYFRHSLENSSIYRELPTPDRFYTTSS